MKWSEEDVAAGLKPIELQYYDDEAASLLALRSGRADVIVQPHAQLVFIAARDKNIKRVGTLSAGWPDRSDVAITTRKGSGLADALTIATNGLIKDGTYAKILDHWHLSEEALLKHPRPTRPACRNTDHRMARVGNISISHIGFLTPGNYPDGDPLSGLEQTLEQLQYGEDLGFDSAWVRQRHLEPGISSASAFLAAATQRTSRIELGTAVIPIGYESPYRLAEDLATVDILSRGRLNIGVSAGRPLHADLIAPLVFDGDWTGYDFSHDRVLRFADNLRGTYLGDEQTLIKTPFGPQRPRLQPYAKGLIDRIWYGGGSQRSAEWA